MQILPRGANIKEPESKLPTPVTEEEFDSMLSAVNRVLVRRLRPHWKAILRSFWHGGLRRSEPLDFRWRDTGFHCPVLEDCEFPYVDWNSRQKNGKYQSVAITEEFADLLRKLPRTNDYVFQVDGPKVRYKGVRQISEIIREIAISAKVKRPTSDGSGHVFATAQHLRRSFGQRMSQRVGPATLRHLMRHSSIATTMRYYVADDARMAAMDLREQQSMK
jgi:integrase